MSSFLPICRAAIKTTLTRLGGRTTTRRFLGSGSREKSSSSSSSVTVSFVKQDGTKHVAQGKLGQNLLDIIIDNDVDVDGFGACEGTLACSTCHLIFKEEDFKNIPDEATDEELDMLDLAYGLVETSRLGCQVCMTKALDGMEVTVPEGVNDQR